MPYLIDGHNLIGQLPDISLKDPHDEAKLVTKLRSFCARTGKQCHVVFDQGIPGGMSKLSNNAVKVVFASRAGDADSIMIQRIQKVRDVKGWTVVSSDEQVLSVAKRRGLMVMRSRDFASHIKQKLALPPKEESPNVYVSPQEVDEWLAIFGEDDV